MRYPIVDGFRGFFLVFMMVVHADIVLDGLVGKLNHHYAGWVEDAQGFVFISGLVVGLVYTRRLLKGGQAALDRAVWERMRTIYLHQGFLILTFLLVGLALASQGIRPEVFTPYVEEPVAFTLASFLLVTGSQDMGILPMYLYFMAVTPLVIRAMHEGRFVAVAAGSAALWLFAQSGLGQFAARSGEDLLAQAGAPMRLGFFFNVFGWQVLFMAGLFFGYLSAMRRLSLAVLHDADMRAAFWIAVATLGGLAVLDRIVFWDLLGSGFSSDVLAIVDRRSLSGLYLLAFVAAAFATVWLLVAGAEDASALVRATSRGLSAVFNWRPLVFLGQHSLTVFTVHILCIYALETWFISGPPPESVANVLLLLSPVPLFAAAFGHAWWVGARRPARPAGSAVERG